MPLAQSWHSLKFRLASLAPDQCEDKRRFSGAAWRVGTHPEKKADRDGQEDNYPDRFGTP